MSSLLRRIQRQVVPSRRYSPESGKLDGRPKLRPYNGRGSRLGVSNEKDPCKTARELREAKRNGSGPVQ